MLLGGDEFGRTQQGNNNAYCQDSEVSWYDWKLIERNQDLFRFVRELIAFRQHNPVLCLNAFYTADDLEWFGSSGGPAEWAGESRALGVLVRPHLPDPARVQSDALCLLFNAGEAAVGFELPQGTAAGWRVCIDTANSPPNDIHALGDEPPIPEENRYRVGPRSLVVLASR